MSLLLLHDPNTSALPGISDAGLPDQAACSIGRTTRCGRLHDLRVSVHRHRTPRPARLAHPRAHATPATSSVLTDRVGRDRFRSAIRAVSAALAYAPLAPAAVSTAACAPSTALLPRCDCVRSAMLSPLVTCRLSTTVYPPPPHAPAILLLPVSPPSVYLLFPRNMVDRHHPDCPPARGTETGTGDHNDEDVGMASRTPDYFRSKSASGCTSRLGPDSDPGAEPGNA
jgi:hypothetical protein